jgi:hypothetical protein
MRHPLQTDSGSQSADSGSKLAAIVSKEGISLPLQLKRFSSDMPILAMTQQREVIASTNHRTGYR